jgi:hypothetical protein
MTTLSEAGPAVTTECPDQGNEFKRQFRVTFFSARIASLPGGVGNHGLYSGQKGPSTACRWNKDQQGEQNST